MTFGAMANISHDGLLSCIHIYSPNGIQVNAMGMMFTSFSFDLFNHRGFKSLDLIVTAIAIVLFGLILRSRRSSTTPLNGPPGDSWMFGVAKRFLMSGDPSSLHVKWAEQYGPAFLVPIGFGRQSIILCDPKACAHFFAKESFLYQSTPTRKAVIGNFLGKGILWAEGEEHRRQRRALTPAFSNASLRMLTLEFYDSAHKIKTHWDNILLHSSTNDAVIEVQTWINKQSLDSLGHTAFSHAFGALDGKPSAIYDVFDSFASDMGTWSKIVAILIQIFPWAFYIPSKGTTSRFRFTDASKRIADDLLEREHGLARGAEDLDGDRSVLGLLLKSERALSENHRTSPEEIIAQIKTLVLAGYETTSITITWALIELSRKQDVQAKLREELLDKFPNTDPTWDDLWYKLPYLDAVVLETLRVHPIVPEIARYASEDDIIPLSRPLTTASGEQVTSLFIAKGTAVTSSIGYLNRSKELWGADADEYIPERWVNLEGSQLRAKEIQGHKHLMSFSDGARICLGKNFALAEIKSVLSVLLKNYIFEFEDGKSPKIGTHFGLLNRPKVEGHDRAEIPLRIRKVQ